MRASGTQGGSRDSSDVWRSIHAGNAHGDSGARAGLALDAEAAADEGDERAMREEAAACAARNGGERAADAAFVFRGALVARGFVLQANTVIGDDDRDPGVVGGEADAQSELTMEVFAARMASGVAGSFERGAQQQIGDDGRERVGGASGLWGHLPVQRIEGAAELAVQRGAQGTNQSEER